MIKNLVLSCGGVAGITFVGCLQILYRNKLLDNLENILGCSVGSMFSLFICLGYTYEELYKLMLNIDINIINDIDYEDITNFVHKYGFSSGNKIIKILNIIVKAKLEKEDITFRELFEKTNKNLIIASTCLNTSKVEYFSFKDNPDMLVLDAVRMSISIPFLFHPFNYKDKLYVDGALLNGYPIDYFKDNMEETLGILINNDNDVLIKNLEDYTLSVLFCGLMNNKKFMYEKYRENTILLSLNSELDCINFFLSKDDKERLIKCGNNCCMKYLESDFFNKHIPKENINQDFNQDFNQDSNQNSNQNSNKESNNKLEDDNLEADNLEPKN